MGKEFDMFDDFFTEDDFKIEDEKAEGELEELELETDDPDDPDLDPVDDPGDVKSVGLGPQDVDPCCDDGCQICGLPDAGADLDDCYGDPDDCDCNQCHGHDGWDTGQQTKWDTGSRKPTPDKGVWKQKTWKT